LAGQKTEAEKMPQFKCRMYFKIQIIVILTLLSFKSEAQNFYKTYGNTDDEIGRSVVETNDTSFLILGSSSSFYEGNSNFYLIKIDSLGIFKWSKVYGGNNVDQGYCIGKKPNGNYLLTGFSNSYGNGYELLNIEIDDSGNVIWHKTCGGTDWDFAYDNTILANGDAFITGSTYSAGNGNQDGFILYLDNNGDSLWIKTVGGTEDDVLRRSILTTDNFLVSTGYKTNATNDRDIYLVKMNVSGDTIWTKTFGGTLDDEGFDVKETPSGGYLVVGKIGDASNGTEGYYFETDTAGIMKWNQTYGGSGEEEFHCVAIKNNQSRFFVARETNSFGSGEYDFGINLLNLPGGWYNGGNTYGSTMTERPYDMIYTSNNRILTVGYSDFPYDNQNVMAVMMDTTFGSLPVPSLYQDLNSVAEIHSDEILFHPNPASEKINWNPSQKMNAEIFSVTGKQIFKTEERCTEIILQTIPSGSYFIRFEKSDGSIFTQKLIISH
jgi:hypothetical protein